MTDHSIVARRRYCIARLHAEGKRPAEILEDLIENGYDTNIGTVRADLARAGLRYRKPNTGEPGGEAARKRRKAAEAGAANVADRRRFKTVPVPMGQAGKLASDESVAEGRTMFPDRVFRPPGPSVEPVLKDGSNNAKIGGDVLIGRLKGAYIATLTLQERATCPETCKLYRACYGNSMPWARRWAAGPELEASLRTEVAEACAANEKVLIRLHVLGDFYSFEYVCLWAELLDAHENLTVFGFTAWDRGTEIGDAIAKLRKVYPSRFMIRVSGRTGAWGSFTIDFPTEQKKLGDAVVCPEQRSAMRGGSDGKHCGNCALCWQSNIPIVFVLH